MVLLLEPPFVDLGEACGVGVGLKKYQVKSLVLPQHRVWGLHVREQGTVALSFQVQALLVVPADCLLHALISAGAQKSSVFCSDYSELIFIRLNQIIYVSNFQC